MKMSGLFMSIADDDDDDDVWEWGNLLA